MTTMPLPVDVEQAPDGRGATPRAPSTETRGAWPRGYRAAVRCAAPLSLVVLLIAFALFLRAYYTPAISHPDANGYFAQASLLVKTGHTWFRPKSNAQYIGMHWLLTPGGGDVYISRYPPGLAVIAGLFYLLGGWQASLLVSPVLALLTLVGVYCFAARLISPAWGLVAACALAVNGAFDVHALLSIAHLPVACCLVWGAY